MLHTNLGTASSFTLQLQPRQTLRVQTIAGSTTETGYAVIYDEEEGNSEYSVDYVLGISVFYQFMTQAGITETVSIPVQEPTAVATVPVEINAPNYYSAAAIVNASDTANVIHVTLYSEDGTASEPVDVSLAARQQLTEFLDEADYFPGLQSFKGSAEFVAERPFVLLSLLQTRAAGENNQQYTLLTPVDKESLRRDSYMVLLQADTDSDPFMPLDIDGFAVDFYRNSDEIEAYSWDLEYRYDPPFTTVRYLRPDNHAEIAQLGYKSDDDFDTLVSLPYLKALTTYSTANVDVSYPVLYTTFAIRTDRGNYAKARIIRVIDTTAGSLSYKDLVLEVVVYR
jgi:hypothetical protein